MLIDARKGGDLFSVSDWFGAQSGASEETASGNIRENGLIIGKDVLADQGAVLAQVSEYGIIQVDERGYAIATTVVNDNVVSAQSYFKSYWGLTEPSVIDGSYIKLREIIVGYSFPKSITNKLRLNSLRFNIVGRNLAILYVDKSNTIGIDPETGFGAGNNGLGIEQYQVPSTRSIGFKISFGF